MFDDSQMATRSAAVRARIVPREKAHIVIRRIKARMIEEVEYVEGVLEVEPLAELGLL